MVPGSHERIDRWRTKLDVVQKDVQALLVRRKVFLGMQDMLDEQQSPERWAFDDPFRWMYIDSVALGVRRQAKSNSQAITLAGLVNDIKGNHTTVDRTWYRSLWKEKHLLEPDDPNVAEIFGDVLKRDPEAFFDTFSQRRGGEQISRGKVQSDIDALNASSAKVINIADTWIAHRDPGAPPIDVTWQQLDDAICVLAQMVARYHRLLTGAVMYNLTPIAVDDWRTVFRDPLAVRDNYEEHVLEAEYQLDSEDSDASD